MANNYLDDLLGKISAYDLFNVLLPGALVTYSVCQMPLGSCIDCSNWLALFVMSYVLGLIASRIGSLCIEPLVRNLKPTRKRYYSAFAYAQKNDPKVEQLLMISNMYRSLAGPVSCSSLFCLHHCCRNLIGFQRRCALLSPYLLPPGLSRSGM